MTARKAIQAQRALRRLMFESVSARVMTRYGMELHAQGGAHDGGVDLCGEWQMPSDDTKAADRIHTVVQCKYQQKPVGVATVRELEGSVVNFAHRISPSAEESCHVLGVLSTVSGFTPFAVKHAISSPIPLALWTLSDPFGGMNEELRDDHQADALASRTKLVSLSLNTAAVQCLPDLVVTMQRVVPNNSSGISRTPIVTYKGTVLG